MTRRTRNQKNSLHIHIMKASKSSILTSLRSVCAVLAFAGVAGIASGAAPQILPPNFMQNSIGTVIGRVDSTFTDGSFTGTATAIKPYSVLTCAHNVYRKGAGWSRLTVFKRSYYQRAPYGTNAALRRVVMAGYTRAVDTSNVPAGQSAPATFALDLAGMVLQQQAAGGVYALAVADPRWLQTNAAKYVLGYGGERTRGLTSELPLYSGTYAPYAAVLRMWMVNAGMGSHGGMSGGPVYVDVGGGNLRVAAVHVSGGPDYTRDAGCRAIDTQAAQLIRDYLR